jgi:hypothetical protein
MDALMDHHDAVDDCVAGLLRPLIDDDLSVVFYDLTTIRTEGLSEQPDDVRRHGMSKEGLIARQFMLGVVQTADGMPIYHEVFAGNTGRGTHAQADAAKGAEPLPAHQAADRGGRPRAAVAGQHRGSWASSS